MSAPDLTLAVDRQLALDHGLSCEEYDSILEHLGRTPTVEELGVFSVMWSEHCSYKSSRAHLARLPQSGPAVLQGPGENAGAVDIGGGMAAIFKIESHNHPSYVEPYQGAATGVGGILRDIFTMGARPVANMNSLRFGSPDHERTPYLVSGVVAGVGGYGNSVGVPTVGGEVWFDEGYDGNILVNAFNLGIVKADRIFCAEASGVGNPVLYVGSKTGRDGIHGASLLASSEFKEDSEQMKPTVQVGDPFTENVLIEACLEVMSGDDIVAIQDMGAAGLTSSSVEMADRGGVGLKIDLDKVPVRDAALTAYEMLLSESQERMLLVAKKGREHALAEVFERWGLDCCVIGEVTPDPIFEATKDGKNIAAIPVAALTNAAPKYRRPSKEPESGPPALDLQHLPDLTDAGRALAELLASPNLCSRRWVYDQYDSWVGANTVVGPGGDAAVVRIRETGGALAMTLDCNARFVGLDPYAGTAHAVAEAARNVAAVGGKPIAISDCLNFGSPEKPEIMWQFERAIDGMADACKMFDAPVISGNVSFYNDTKGSSIPPSPVVAMVGLIEDATRTAGAAIRREGDAIFLLGDGQPDLNGSEYLKLTAGLTGDRVPELDLEAELRTSDCCRRAIAEGLVDTAHDVGEGGLAVALAEMSLARGARSEAVEEIGSVVDCPLPTRWDEALFGESGRRFLLSVEPEKGEALEQLAADCGVPLRRIGSTGGARIVLRERGGAELVDMEVAELRALWARTLGDIAEGRPAGVASTA